MHALLPYMILKRRAPEVPFKSLRAVSSEYGGWGIVIVLLIQYEPVHSSSTKAMNYFATSPGIFSDCFTQTALKF